MNEPTNTHIHKFGSDKLIINLNSGGREEKEEVKNNSLI